MNREESSADIRTDSLYRSMFEQSPQSIQVFAPDGRTISVNRAWEELWGLSLVQLGDYNVLADQQLIAKGIMPFIERGFAGEATDGTKIVAGRPNFMAAYATATP